LVQAPTAGANAKHADIAIALETLSTSVLHEAPYRARASPAVVLTLMSRQGRKARNPAEAHAVDITAPIGEDIQISYSSSR